MDKAIILTLGLSISLLAGCQTETLSELETVDTDTPKAIQGPRPKPIFENSVVSNEIDFIKAGDPAVDYCIALTKTTKAEMPDKRGGELMASGVSLFEARFADGTKVGLWTHPDLKSQETAKTYANHVARAVSYLPSKMRKTLSHVVIHQGNETAFGESEGHFFVLYSQNIDMRLRNHDLEETVFHESVHATLDARWANHRSWRAAQAADRAYITNYARAIPNKEDLAESALFAHAELINPGRLPADVSAKVRTIMPNRLAFFEKLFGSMKPLQQKVGSPRKC